MACRRWRSIEAHEVRFSYVLSRQVVIVQSRQRLDVAWSHVAIPFLILEAAVAEIRSGLARGALGLTPASGPVITAVQDAP